MPMIQMNLGGAGRLSERDCAFSVTHNADLDTSSALGQGRTIINKKDEKDIL